MDKKYEIPFGAKDSELKGWEYTIPEGMEAEIKDGKIIVREKESENERIKKSLIEHIKGITSWNYFLGISREQMLAWLERQGEQNLANSEKTCKDEQNPAWSEDDENEFKWICVKLQEHHMSLEYTERVRKAMSWLKSLKERYTWKPSESDILLLERIANGKSNPQDFQASLCGLIGQLKKLKG